MKPPKDDVACCFGVIAEDGRRSSVWRVWSAGDDVYVCPRETRYNFKISLHRSGKWRMAYDKKYAGHLRNIGRWTADRCFEHLDRPQFGHALGFTRGVRMYFPESELRLFTEGWQEAEAEPIHRVSAPKVGNVRVIDLVYTNSLSRFNESEPPLAASNRAEQIMHWKLPNGDVLWLLHFCWRACADEVTTEADWFRQNFARATKLDDRSALHTNTRSARIMISGENEDGWFAVIDAASATS